MDLINKIEDLLKEDPFKIRHEEKHAKLLNIIKLQIEYHLERCSPYRLWYERNEYIKAKSIRSFDEVPYIPSAVFKYLNLTSSGQQVKEIRSSGTSSQLKSKISLDSQTSKNQIKSLSKILSSVIGKRKKSFFIVDIAPESIKSKNNIMSARFAGMSGYLLAAKSRNYLLKLDHSGNIILNEEAIGEMHFLSKTEPVIIIGYTYMIWEYLINNSSFQLDFSLHEQTKLIHFGGWKKLSDKNIDKPKLINKIYHKLNIHGDSIYDIYGFTEQLGTIYVSQGLKGCRVSSYSNVLVRNVDTLEVTKDGDQGFLQFISALPTSYPGFSILNDDIGSIVNRTIDQDGSEVLEFKVSSRLEQAETRGCGDTLPENFYI